MRKTETAEREGFRIWAISVVPPLAGQEAKGSIAGIISSFLPKTVCYILCASAERVF